MFRYRLHSPDGDDLGEATYAQQIRAGEGIIAGDNQRFRVLDVVPFEERNKPALHSASRSDGYAARPPQPPNDCVPQTSAAPLAPPAPDS